MGIHIITDSASDVASNSYSNVTVLPMSISFGTETFQDGVNLTHQEFYEKLIESNELPITSQINPYCFEEAIRERTQLGDTVIIITMSSKLSGTFQSASIAASEFPGQAFVVDSRNVTIGEHVLVACALRMIEEGLNAPAIVERLNEIKENIHLVALLDTLEYLKKGGRISKALAFAGGMLSIKPVVAVQDGEIVVLGKARGSKQANNLIAEQIKLVGGVDFSQPHFLGYTGLSDALIKKYIADNAALWQDEVESLPVQSVGGTIGTHAGPGAIAVAFVSQK